jgi:hypothetical protein
VHHRHAHAGAIRRGLRARVRQAGVLTHRQCAMSARSITVGPSPLRITPTTPVLPTAGVTSKPAARSRSAATPAVRVSCMDSSGCACISV